MGDALCIEKTSSRELEAQGTMSDALSLRNRTPVAAAGLSGS